MGRRALSLQAKQVAARAEARDAAAALPNMAHQRLRIAALVAGRRLTDKIHFRPPAFRC